MIRNISIAILLFISSGILAQKPDSVKAPRVLKELNLSHQKPDSIKAPRILKEWNLSHDFSEEVGIPFDTVFSLFHRFKITDRYSSLNASLGNYGLPLYQLNFFDRITDPDKFLYSNYYPFMHLPDNAIFMNTQTPFTELDWTFAGPKETAEQTFRIRHTQNVNRFLNFGLIYDIVYSLGQYNYQRAEDKTFTFFSSYTGPKYKLYFSAGINSLISHENGGVKDVNDLSKFVASKIRDVPVNLGSLNNAIGTLKNHNLLLVQRYELTGNPIGTPDSLKKKHSGFLGLSGTFSHIFILETNGRTYSDKSPKSGFYDTILISRAVTFDSLYSRNIKNTIRFDFTTDESRKFRLGGGIGIRNELFKYYSITPVPYLVHANNAVFNLNDNVLIGKLYNNIGEKFRWIATGELYLTGYRAGDFNFDGEISKSFDFKKGRATWLITGSIDNRQPSFWFDRWGGNHFGWDNNFSKEFRIDVGSSFVYPERKTEFKFNYAIIHNYTDFNTLALPSQYSGSLSVMAINVKKDIKAWKFHFNNDLLIQKTSNIVILDLPLATIRSSVYFDHLFKFTSTGGRLNFQIGAEGMYNTAYHSYSYMPATGRFYRQNLVTTGNYPFVNAFINFKVKRTRFFLMMDHLNAGSTGYNYDMIPGYPMNVRMFRYGLAWTFYD